MFSFSDIYFEIMLTSSQKHKFAQRKKTESYTPTDEINFIHHDVFDVPIKFIDKVALIITLKVVLQDEKHFVLGRTVISNDCEDFNACNHWKVMLANPRQAVKGWHYVRQ